MRALELNILMYLSAILYSYHICENFIEHIIWKIVDYDAYFYPKYHCLLKKYMIVKRFHIFTLAK